MAARRKGNESRGPAWFLTWNNPPENWAEQLKAKFSEAEQYVCQHETGENGTPHIQGYVKWRRRKRLGAVANLVRQGHWERCNNNEAAKAYCDKVETRTGETIRKGIRKAVVDKIAGTLYPWQQRLENALRSTPEDRKIIWYADPLGAAGKTAFVKHRIIHNRKSVIMVNGKASDIKCAVKIVLDTGQDIEEVYFCIPRKLEQFVSYQAIEEVKDGLFFSGKYEGGCVLMNVPHVIVMANFLPDLTALTLDRWEVHNLSQEGGLL